MKINLIDINFEKSVEENAILYKFFYKGDEYHIARHNNKITHFETGAKLTQVDYITDEYDFDAVKNSLKELINWVEKHYGKPFKEVLNDKILLNNAKIINENFEEKYLEQMTI